MKPLTIVFFTGALSAILFSCVSEQSIKPGDFEGIYMSEGDYQRQLVFKEDNFWLIETKQSHMPIFVCCDTLADGTWKIEENKKYVAVQSDEKYKSNFLPLSVKESMNTNKDSVRFTIVNPVENFYNTHNVSIGNRDILYKVDITSNNRAFDLRLSSKYFDRNIITVARPEDLQIKGFSIEVIPDFDFGGNHIGVRQIFTIPYNVMDLSSTSFFISIKDLDYQFMTSRRLKNDYIKIIGPDKLLWDDVVYSKQ